MANGTDSEDKFLVLSKIRVGLKREFEFALKVQSEICGSLGRTRARKIQNNVEVNCDTGSPQPMRLKTYESRKKRKKEEKSIAVKLDKETEVTSEEEAKSDVVDAVIDEAKVDSNGEREILIYERELICEYVVRKDQEGKNVSENAVDDEKGILMNEDQSKVENYQIEEENNEPEITAVGVEIKENEYDKVLTSLEEDNCEELYPEKGENVRMEDEKNEPEKPTVGVEDEKKNESDKVPMDIEEDKCEKLVQEKGEHNQMGEEKNEPEQAAVGVELEKKNDSDKVSTNVEEDKCQKLDQEKKNESERTVTDVVGKKENDFESKLVENGVLVRTLEGKNSSNFCKETSSLEEPAVIGGNDEGKVVNGVVERPLRRFTRSLLQQKGGLVKECKDGGKENDVNEVAIAGDDATGTPLAIPPTKQQTVMKLKKVMRKFYTKLKDFLDSGILEGMPVKYIRGLKVKGPGVRGLRGVIKGSGILCFCGDCKGHQVVTPAVFELHAGSSNKRPPEYIYLENGNTLRDVMNACKNSPLETLEEAIRTVLGSLSMKKSSFCLNCRGSITDACVDELVLLCNSCTELKECKARSVELTGTSDRSPKPNSTQKSSHTKMKSSLSKSHGKITRKDLRMHKLVFEEGGLEEGTELAYFVRGQKFLVGYKRGSGIFCSCCKSEVSPSQFEAHAGWASRRKPFQHIYTSNGVSLHEFSISLSRERRFSIKENDDLCGICMDGGNLLCCDSCPRAFHIDCVSLPDIPRGHWYCRYCQNTFQKEKFVVHNANAIAAGRVLGVDPIAEITSRCIRVVQTPDTELGGCVLCRGRDFCKTMFGRRTVILCDQCEREYHIGCLRDHGMEDLKELPKGKWLCCADCKRINSVLQKLVDRGEEQIPETSLDVIKKKHPNNGCGTVVDVDVRWRVLRGKKSDSSDGTRVLLSKAVAIFHDRFDPIIENASKLDLIPSMVYGRNHKDQDYHGMYCAILTVNKVVVSAGIFRIFGRVLAELPLVATTTECQSQGYFQCLFSCIEKLLGFLNVKTLVLPSASEARDIWTNKFGFHMMTQDEQNKYRNDYPLMIFQGTAMLQKPVPKCRIVGKSLDD